MLAWRSGGLPLQQQAMDGVLGLMQRIPWSSIHSFEHLPPPLGLLGICVDAAREGRLVSKAFSATIISVSIALQMICTCGAWDSAPVCNATQSLLPLRIRSWSAGNMTLFLLLLSF